MDRLGASSYDDEFITDPKGIFVAVRVRPLFYKEKCDGARSCCEAMDDISGIRIRNTAAASLQQNILPDKETDFAFDAVFSDTSTQGQVYRRTTKPLIPRLMAGFNVAVFAYGTTSAGKTHTMFGSSTSSSSQSIGSIPGNSTGIIPSAVNEVVANVYEKNRVAPPGERWETFINYIEVYNEQVYDLLASDNSRKERPVVSLREDQRGIVVLAGVTEHKVVTIDEVMDAIARGNVHRVVDATTANRFSSRSHAVLQVTVRRTVANPLAKSQVVEAPKNSRWSTGRSLRREVLPQAELVLMEAKLSLIDLAGSEKTTKIAMGSQIAMNGTKSKRLTEGANINKSLLALANCINALAENSSGKLKRKMNVKYRDSKLTLLLKNSLEGKSHLVIIANVNPSHFTYEDTLNTLKYANRAKNIKITPTASALSDSAGAISKEQVAALAMRDAYLSRENDHLRARIAELENYIKFVGLDGAGGGGGVGDAAGRVGGLGLGQGKGGAAGAIGMGMLWSDDIARRSLTEGRGGADAVTFEDEQAFGSAKDLDLAISRLPGGTNGIGGGGLVRTPSNKAYSLYAAGARPSGSYSLLSSGRNSPISSAFASPSVSRGNSNRALDASEIDGLQATKRTSSSSTMMKGAGGGHRMPPFIPKLNFLSSHSQSQSQGQLGFDEIPTPQSTGDTEHFNGSHIEGNNGNNGTGNGNGNGNGNDNGNGKRNARGSKHENRRFSFLGMFDRNSSVNHEGEESASEKQLVSPPLSARRRVSIVQQTFSTLRRSIAAALPTISLTPRNRSPRSDKGTGTGTGTGAGAAAGAGAGAGAASAGDSSRSSDYDSRRPSFGVASIPSSRRTSVHQAHPNPTPNPNQPGKPSWLASLSSKGGSKSPKRRSSVEEPATLQPSRFYDIPTVTGGHGHLPSSTSSSTSTPYSYHNVAAIALQSQPNKLQPYQLQPYEPILQRPLSAEMKGILSSHPGFNQGGVNSDSNQSSDNEGNYQETANPSTSHPPLSFPSSTSSATTSYCPPEMSHADIETIRQMLMASDSPRPLSTKVNPMLNKGGKPLVKQASAVTNTHENAIATAAATMTASAHMNTGTSPSSTSNNKASPHSRAPMASLSKIPSKHNITAGGTNGTRASKSPLAPSPLQQSVQAQAQARSWPQTSQSQSQSQPGSQLEQEQEQNQQRQPQGRHPPAAQKRRSIVSSTIGRMARMFSSSSSSSTPSTSTSKPSKSTATTSNTTSSTTSNTTSKATWSTSGYASSTTAADSKRLSGLPRPKSHYIFSSSDKKSTDSNSSHGSHRGLSSSG
jgi:hypothetical protein